MSRVGRPGGHCARAAAGAVGMTLLAGAMLAGAGPAWAPAPVAAAGPTATTASLALGGGGGQAIAWLTNLDLALEEARVLRRPIMVDLWAQWCRWCHELDRRTYSQAPVIERAQAMTCAKVNADLAPELGRRYQIRGLPTILFLDRHGTEINRVTGFVEAGPFAGAMDAVLSASSRLSERQAEYERAPEDPARIYALADEYLAAEQFRAAEPLLAALTPAGAEAGSPFEADAVLDLAVARAGNGDRAGARKILEGFLAAYPGAPRWSEAELRLGQLLLAEGETKAARRHLEAVAQEAGRGPWKAEEARRLLATASGGQ